MIKKVAKEVAENLANQMQEKMSTKFEWHTFTCQSNHEFAIKISVDVTVSHVVEIYQSIRCPICESATLKKQANL